MTTTTLTTHKFDPIRFISAATAFLVAMLALGALALSYDALRAVAGANGIEGWKSLVWPLLIDASLVVFSLAVVRNSLRGESTRWPWFLVGLYTLATVVFNLLHSPGNLTAYAAAIVAPVSLFLSFETLMGQLKSEVKRSAVVADIDTLTNEASRIRADVSRLSAEIDTLTGKRDQVKAELSDLRKEKRQNFTAIGDDTRDQATAILAERPGITGADLGRELGKSESLGRKLKRELSPGVSGNGNGVTR